MNWFTDSGKFISEPEKDPKAKTYIFAAPTTAECYVNTIEGDPIDDNSNGIAAALDASILRSTVD